MEGKKGRIENLTHVKPGQVLNPNGRGKGTLNFKTRLEKWLKTASLQINPLEIVDPKNPPKAIKMKQLDIIILAQIAEARKGKTKAFIALMDRMVGKPLQESKVISENKNYNYDMPPLTADEIKGISDNLENAI